MSFDRSSTAARQALGLGICGVIALNISVVSFAQAPPAEQPAGEQPPAGQPDENGQDDRPRDRGERRWRGFDGPPGMPGFESGRGRGPGSGGPGGFGPGGPGGGPMGGFGQLMEPEFMRRDMPMFVQTLELDDSQRPILETLLVDYSEAFNTEAEAMREKFQNVRPRTPEQEARSEKRRELGEQMRDAVRELREIRQSTPEGQEPDAAKSDAIRQRMEDLQKQMVELRPPRPEGEELKKLRDSMTALGNEWRATRKSLRDGFITDVQIILVDEQEAKWPVLERQLRREKTLRRSQLSGEGVDLFHIVREMRLNADEALAIEPAMLQYDMALDAALIARNDRMDVLRGEMMGAMMDRNVEQVQKLAEEEVRLRTAVRTANEQAVENVSAAMNADLAKALKDQFARQAYPRIMRPTFAQRSLEAAVELEGLAPETLAAVHSLQEQYTLAVTSANAELIVTLRETEPQRITQRTQFWVARMNDQEPPAQGTDVLREKMQKRFALDEEYRKRLETVLTPEQIAQLPPVPAPRGEGGPDGPRGDRQFDRGGPNPEMMQRFDTNNDGTIDDQERQQMRERFRRDRETDPPI